MLSFDESEHALRNEAMAAEIVRDVVVVEGPEAAGYLHGQLSQNVEGLAEGASAWSLLLEPVGRVTSWLRITRVGSEEYWLDTDPGAGEATLARLERFKLRTKATFALSTSLPSIAIRGTNSPAAISFAADLDSMTHRVIAVDLDWPGSIGVDLLGADLAGADQTALTNLLAEAGVPLGDQAVIELERVESGRPAMGAEFAEKTIPAETGVVDRSADFTKGCYVGQELVARVDSRGNNTPRTVHPVRLAAGMAPIIGSDLVVDGAPIGVITSVASGRDHVAALASIKRGVEVPLAAQVEIDGQLAMAEVSAVHWL